MGSTLGADHERPPREVEITQPFYMGVTEVTQAQWKAVMGDNPSKYTNDVDLLRPVERVEWDRVQTFDKRQL
jgi:formylglycine-generating enzyme required for sulfatase activity